MRRDLLTAGLYIAALVPVAAYAVVLTYVMLDLAPRFSPPWIGLLLNVLPAAAVGTAFYYRLARWRATSNSWRQHAIRALPLYLLISFLAEMLIQGFRNPRSGIGLVAQLFVWPMAAAFGGVVGDGIAAAKRSNPNVSQAAI